MSDTVLNLYQVLIKFRGFRTYEIQFEGETVEDSLKYSIVANVCAHIRRKKKIEIISYGNLLAVELSSIFNVSEIKEVVETILTTKGYNLTFTISENEISSDDANPVLFQQLIERFAIVKINDFLRKSGFKTLIKGKRIFIPLQDLVDNASLTMGNYSAERYVTIRAVSNKSDITSPFLQIDVSTTIEGMSTIWQQLQFWLKKRNKTLSDLKEDISLQEEANLEFKSDNPRLTTTYKRQTSTGAEKKDIYFFVGFDFQHTPETRIITMSNGEEITVSEYYLKKYNIKLSEKEQLIVNVKRASRGKGRSGSFEPIPIPSNLVVESPDTKVLERYDFSYQYSQFTLLAPKKRFEIINKIALILQGNNLISKEVSGKYSKIPIPTLFDGKMKFSLYEGERGSGRCLRYPKLKKLKILFFGKTSSWFTKNDGWQIIRELKDTIHSHLSYIASQSQQTYEDTHYEVIFEVDLNNWKKRFDDIATKSKDFNAFLIITSPPNQRFYNYVKQKYTIRKQQPTQFLYFSTLKKLYKKGHLKGLVKSISKQIIVKCGGIPYLLSNNSNSGIVYIGVDRSRDVFGDQPSLSAGVAAVAPNGEYLGADTTSLDRYADDFIDISSILPNIIERILHQNKNINTIVLLRDGGKYSISEHEIKTAKEITQKSNLNLIFLSANKSSGFRAFIKRDSNIEGFAQPVIFSNLPNDPEDFLIFSTLPKQGTQTPILYSILENTTDYPDNEIKKLLSRDLAGLCSLVWEATSPTNLPLPLHYADKLAGFCKSVEHPWAPEINAPLFI